MSNNQFRASLFNLIIYAEDLQRMRYFREIVQTIIQKFPCRIIFIQNETHEKKDCIKSETITVRSDHEDSGIVCDQTTIKFSGSCIKRVPFQVLASLAPDLPIYLLWGKEPGADQDILPQLMGFANHLIFDSECIDNLAAFSEKMLQNKKKTETRIVDMNWARFTGWREVLSHAFDTQERVEELRSSSAIHIVYNSQPSASFQHHDTQARYMQAWIASVMKWEYTGRDLLGDEESFHFKSNGKETYISLKPAKFGSFAPGAIISFSSSGPQGESTSLIRHENSPKQVCAQICSAHTCELPFTIPLYTLTRGLTFIKQILYSPVSTHYKQMLEMLALQK